MAIYKLKDICLKIGSGATPKGGKEAYCDEGISLIRSQNVLDFTFSYDGLAHINDPVSYTHLDVYKRQRWSSRSL